MSSVDQRYDEFVERDLFLHLLLGLVSATERARRVLPGGVAHRAPVAASVGPGGEDAPLMFLLGVAAFTLRVRSHLAAAAAQGQERLAARAHDAAGSGRRVLPSGALR